MLDTFRKQFKNINSDMLDRMLSEHPYANCHVRNSITGVNCDTVRNIVLQDNIMVKIIKDKK